MTGTPEVDTQQNPAVTLLVRAARDGHTLLTRSVVGTGLAGQLGSEAAAAAAIESALRERLLVAPTPAELALPDLAEDEELLADVLRDLVMERRLALVRGPAGPTRTQSVLRLALAAAEDGAHAEQIDAAESLGVADALARLEDLPEDALLILAGDPDLPGPPTPGSVFLDLLASDVAPVVVVEPEPGVTALARLVAALRTGNLTAPDKADRSFVVVPVADDAEVLRRVEQLVSTSIPRAFQLSGKDIAVLTPLLTGPGGAPALAAAVHGECEVTTIAGAIGRTWPAVVLVLPPGCAGVLDRSLVLAGASRAGTHLSVVHGVGADLASAVSTRPRRNRRTRLSGLLQQDPGA